MKFLYSFLFVFYFLYSMDNSPASALFDFIELRDELQKIFGSAWESLFLKHCAEGKTICDLLGIYDKEGRLGDKLDLPDDALLSYDAAFYQFVFTMNELILCKLPYGNLYVFLNCLPRIKRCGEVLFLNYNKLRGLKSLDLKSLHAGHRLLSCYIKFFLQSVRDYALDLSQESFARAQLARDGTKWQDPFEKLLQLIDEED